MTPRPAPAAAPTTDPASAAGPSPQAPPPPHSLVAFGAVWFSYFAGIGLLNPFAPLWFKELGFSTLAIGTIASLQSGTRVVAPYAWGWLADRSGERVRYVRLAALGSLLAALALLGARSYVAVALAIVALYIANGGIVPLSEATLAHQLQTAQGHDARRYGRVRVWGSLGFVVSVVAGGAALQASGIDGFPLFAVGVTALLLASTLWLPRERREVLDPALALPLGTVLRRPAVRWFFASVFFTVLGHVALYAFFSLYLQQLGYPESLLGLLWALAVGAEMVFFWFQGRLFARVDALRWLRWGAAAAVLRFAGLAAFGGSLAVVAALQLLHALSFAAHHAACIAQVSRHFPGALRARGQALYSMLGYGVSGVLGGVAGGWIGSELGFRAVFWAAAGAALCGWACAGQALRHDRPG